jgi:ankyrin repeat protein
MKAQILKAMKIVTKLSMIMLVFLMVSCQESQTKSGRKNEKQTKVSPPTMDIHTAAFMGNVKEIKKHVLAGTDLNKKDKYGSTALITATTFGKTAAAEALIS